MRARGCDRAGRNERRRDTGATDWPRRHRGGAGAERFRHLAGPKERRHARGVRRRESHRTRGRSLRADRSARRAPELFEYRSPGDFAGTRYLVVSPRHARQEWWLWTPATRRTRKLGGTYPGLQRDEIFFGTDLS